MRQWHILDIIALCYFYQLFRWWLDFKYIDYIFYLKVLVLTSCYISLLSVLLNWKLTEFLYISVGNRLSIFREAYDSISWVTSERKGSFPENPRKPFFTQFPTHSHTNILYGRRKVTWNLLFGILQWWKLKKKNLLAHKSILFLGSGDWPRLARLVCQAPLPYWAIAGPNTTLTNVFLLFENKAFLSLNNINLEVWSLQILSSFCLLCTNIFFH